MKLKLKPAKNSPLELYDIREDYIRLDALLKFSAAAETGGEAKQMIQEGEVSVNREICTQRGRKIRSGDIVRASGRVMTVRTRPELDHAD